MPVRQTYQRGDIEISYLEWHLAKNTRQPPLVLLHGLADSATVWSSLGNYLASEYRIIAIDLRGHGESSKPVTGYSSPEIIADLEALLSYLDLAQAHILGHSWGAKLAAIWATRTPQRFSSLILVDPFYINSLPSWLKITFPFFYKVLPFLQGMGPFANKSEAEELAKNLKQYRQWTPLQQQAFNASIELKADGTWGSKFTIAARNGIFTDVMQQSGLTNTLTIPSLFIQPTAGLNRSKWQLKPYYRYLSNLQVKQIPGNHWVFLVNPEQFNLEIAKFLKTLL